MAEGPGPFEETVQLEIDEQLLAADNWLPVRFVHAEVVHLQRKEERVDAHLADGGLLAKLIMYDPWHIASRQIGPEQETCQGVGDEQARADQKPFVAQDLQQAVHGLPLYKLGQAVATITMILSVGDFFKCPGCDAGMQQVG